MMRTAITLAVALVAIAPMSAQTTKGGGSAPTPVDATVSQIHDRRTTSSFSSLNIALELAGTTASDVAAARVTIQKAVDNTGRNLVDPEDGEAQFAQTTGSYLPKDAAKGPASVDISLLNPSRDATTISELRGEVDLYMPGKDPAATAMIAKFTTLAGKPVTNKALKASGVEVSVLGPAQLEAEKKKASKARADQLKKEGNDADTIKWMIESFESSFITPSEGEVVLKVKDPSKRIHEFAFVDGAGEAQRVFPRESDGYTILSSYGATPAADWNLKISLRTPKTMARRSFIVKNIELP